MLELNQIYNSGGFSEYLTSDGWNVVEFSQFFVLVIYIIMNIYLDNNAETRNAVMAILSLIVVLQLFIKILYFIRLFDDLGFLVQMVNQTIQDVAPFTTYMFLYIIFFAMCQKVLRIEYDSDDYTNLEPSIIILL